MVKRLAIYTPRKKSFMRQFSNRPQFAGTLLRCIVTYMKTKDIDVSRIVATVTIENAADLSRALTCEALVDTGASHMVLPSAWKDRLGEFQALAEIEVETATQERVIAEVCGPVRIQIEGFRAIFSEVAFVEMNPERGEFEPLIGYIVLEQSLAGVDMIGHRLIHLKHLDLKCLTSRAETQANYLTDNVECL
jgi:predicted aspartyl protease